MRRKKNEEWVNEVETEGECDTKGKWIRESEPEGEEGKREAGVEENWEDGELELKWEFCAKDPLTKRSQKLSLGISRFFAKLND